MNAGASYGRKPRHGFGLLALTLASSWTFAANAQQTRLAEDPDASAIMTLRLEVPAALLLMERGDAALKQAHFAEAAALFDEASHLSPKSALLQRKSCEALAGVGKRQEALKVCEHAYELGARSAYDTRKMVAVRLNGKELPTPLDVYQAHDYAETAIRFDSSLPWGYAGMGELGYRIGDDELLARSTWQLQKLAPNHPETKALERLSVVAGHSRWTGFVRWATLLLVLGTFAHSMVMRAIRAFARSVAASGHVPTP